MEVGGINKKKQDFFLFELILNKRYFRKRKNEHTF